MRKRRIRYSKIYGSAWDLLEIMEQLRSNFPDVKLLEVSKIWTNDWYLQVTFESRIIKDL
jgi:hypothetical protein